MGFTVNNTMLNNIGRVSDNAGKLEARESFRFDYIPIDKIHRSDKNFFGLREIEELAESIEQNGLQHNIVLRESDSGYELISGERRLRAYELLRQRHGEKYKLIPAKVVSADDIDAEISLIHANTEVRQLTPAELLQSVERLKELYNEKQRRGENISGRLRERLASDLKISVGQVGNLENISANLDAASRERFLSGQMSVPEALATIRNKKPSEPKPKEFNRYKFPSALIERHFAGYKQKEIEAAINQILIDYLERSERSSQNG